MISFKIPTKCRRRCRNKLNKDVQGLCERMRNTDEGQKGHFELNRKLFYVHRQDDIIASRCQFSQISEFNAIRITITAGFLWNVISQP